MQKRREDPGGGFVLFFAAGDLLELVRDLSRWILADRLVALNALRASACNDARSREADTLSTAPENVSWSAPHVRERSGHHAAPRLS
jgi:hypothetical protein